MRGLLALCALAVLACAPGPPPAADHEPPVATAQVDTLRGTVQVVGSEPGTSVVLTDSGGKSVTLMGEETALRSLAALEVAVEGRRESPEIFRVERVAVRAANGVPATDGRLARDGAGWVLVTADGRRLPVAALPHDLRGRAGARVWLAGPLDRAPDAFGIIAEAP